MTLFSFCSLSSCLQVRSLLKSAVVAAVIALFCGPMWAAQTSTTTLTVRVQGQTVTSAAPGTVIALTATVTATPYNAGASPGLVRFCDVTLYAACTDIRLLATMPVSAAGQATYYFTPSQGAHTYKAVYLPNAAIAGSSSTTQNFTITGVTTPTTTTVAQSGMAGNYTLTSTVTSVRNAYPNSSVSFLDKSYSNASLGSATLTAGGTTLGATQNSAGGNTSNVGDARTIVTGDFNNDGYPDTAAIYNQYANGNYQGYMRIFLGSASGLQGGAIYDLGGGIETPNLVVGDFNGDGKLDMIQTVPTDSGNYINGAYRLLAGNGDGTFSFGSYIQLYNTGPMAIGDFNNDGILDVAMAQPSNNSFVILTGKGDGTFTAGTSFALGFSPVAIVAADFNSDGFPDIAVTGSKTVAYKGSAAGSFTLFSALANTPGTSLAAANLNRAGYIDLVILGGGVLTVASANNNYFSGYTTQTVNATDQANTLAVGDFDLDGNADLLITGPNSTNAITYLHGAGTATFAQQQVVGTGQGLGPVVVGDFNADGYPDFACAFDQGSYGYLDAAYYITNIAKTSTATLTGVSVSQAGPHNVFASYNGASGVYQGASQSATTVLYPTEAITLVSSMPGGSVGQQVVLTATISPYTAQGQSSDGENVSFYSAQNNLLGTAPLSSGVASLNVTSLPVGLSELTASYAGDAELGAATSKSVPYRVQNGTTTSLAITSGGAAVSSVAAGSPVNLTATVTLGGAAVHPGQVKFCNAAAPRCENGAVLGTAQLSASGTATIKIRPARGTGSQSYSAIFLPTSQAATSTSAVAALTVTGTLLGSTTAYSSTLGGGQGNYTISAQVTGSSYVPPSGLLSFLDSSNNNAVVGTATLSKLSGTTTLAAGPTLTTANGPSQHHRRGLQRGRLPGCGGVPHGRAERHCVQGQWGRNLHLGYNDTYQLWRSRCGRLRRRWTA